MPLMGELFFSRLWVGVALLLWGIRDKKSDGIIQDKKEVHVRD